ncbi:MAG TPA: gliding motility-associated C-terminal domain-containing protein [Chryseosolibacter sp.]
MVSDHKIVVTALLLLGGLSASAQTVNRGAVISIKPNTILSIKTDFTNNGTVVNNGNLVIAGRWQNNETYDAGSGGITFNSDIEQIINHNDQSFSHLTISGGGRKLFLANITIEKELVFQDGILTSQNGAHIVFTPGSTAIGGSDVAHINGRVYHQGTGNLLYPVGNGSTYLPVTLNDVPANTQVGIEVQNIPPGTSLSTRAPLIDVVSENVWFIDVVQGNLESSSITLPAHNLAPNVKTETVVVAQSQSPTGPFSSLGQSEFAGTAQQGFVTALQGPAESFVTLATSADDGSITVFNGVSPDGDGLNDYWHIENIDKLPDAQPNKVTIFNRWGDALWTAKNYDNVTNVFTGSDLPAGTYFYKIEFPEGRKTITGFLSLKR